MAIQAKAKGMLIFLNHRYNVPEDVFGDVVDAKALSRAQDGEGVAVWDMDLDIELASSNPRTGKTMELIETDKKKLGVSIGAQISEWEFKDKDAGWFGGLIIKKVDLLEASIVGIPANQRSWVQNAVAAIKRASAKKTADPDTDDESDTDVIDTIAPTILGGLTPLDPALLEGIEAKPGEVWELVNNADGTSTHRQVTDPAELSKFWTAAGTNLIASVSTTPAIVKTDTDDGSETDPAETPEAGDPSPEGDVEASTEPGTDDPAQESTELPATPAALDGSPSTEASTPDSSPAMDASLANAMAVSLAKATSDLLALAAQNSDLVTENASLKGELSQAKKHAAAADELIETIAKLPLGRKTAFAAPIDDFASTVKRIWGSDVAKHVE